MTTIEFSGEEKKLILQIARESGRAEIERKKQKDYSEICTTPNLTMIPGGVFVTFKIKGELRGCIGCFSPEKPVYELIQEYAVCACNDSRFDRMTVEEYDKTTISVSCLSPSVDTKDPLKEVIAGKHGIRVQYGYYRGTYLPQVATEQGWDTKTFCTHCAYHKAGISTSVDVFNNPKVKWQIYTATIVSE
ncbi:AMMECR1 domain containing protein [Entamoeba invadens IP1]|uniref:AMMECR1 domain containing protein n=1 Tax=Entamoeba invadens IP1 TaxID=370355 RepID=UPI0002C3E450|nr:AMMECR1 domain containing protein [Entamoeba invadens IP1]ELP94116.1 AMMECR1 domain containing protein [Entamoeba invadens IP1]|eukprot:XP_004260887.1 AMMECR1 domain containing protein [Entamoeba invadens IP1]